MKEIAHQTAESTSKRNDKGVHQGVRALSYDPYEPKVRLLFKNLASLKEFFKYSMFNFI